MKTTNKQSVNNKVTPGTSRKTVTKRNNKSSVTSRTVTKPTPRTYKLTEESKIPSIRRQAQQLIDSYRPYAVMMTINFARRYDDKFAQEKMSELVKRINRRIFGRAHEKRRKHARLVGVCVAEVTYGGALDLCLHFHFKIQPCRRFDSTNAEQVLRPIVARELDLIRDDDGRKIVDTSPESTDLRFDNDTGEGVDSIYLTKQHKLRGSVIYDHIGILDFDGVSCWNIPENRMKQDLIGQVAVY